MSVSILESEGRAVIYCNTTEIALGPIFYAPEGDNRDATDMAQAFLEWLPQDARTYERQDLLERRDIFLSDNPTSNRQHEIEAGRRVL